jgi:hypothetical protein
MDVHLELDPPNWIYSYNNSVERRTQELRAWAKEFEGFIRDHRSRDAVSVNVIEERKDLCSVCGGEWETYQEEGETFCACCGALVEEVPHD